MNTDKNSSQSDEISQLLEQMHDEIILKRFQVMEKRRSNKEDKAQEEIELAALIELEGDFNSLLKTHTNYLRFKKQTGQPVTITSDALAEKLKVIKNNMGSIISTLPSVQK